MFFSHDSFGDLFAFTKGRHDEEAEATAVPKAVNYLRRFVPGSWGGTEWFCDEF